MTLALAGTVNAQETDVTIVLASEPVSLDPCMTAANDNGRVALGNIFNGLTARNPETGALEPALASSWTQLDGNKWEFDLRDGVTFHDGSPLDAEAVKYSIERTLNENLTCETRTKFFAGGEYAVEAADADTIVITTDATDPILPLKMANVMIHPTSVPFDELQRTAPGTGPYVLDDWAAGQRVLLTRYDGYWGETPEVATGKFIWRSESSVRAAMVTQGEADLAPSIAVQDVTEEYGVAYPNAESTRLNLDMLTPPLDDRRIREAIALAIDRDAMLGTVMSSGAEKATQLYHPTTIGWSDEVTMWEYDPERARALLDEAKADGVPIDAPIQFIGRIGHFPGAKDFHEVIAIMLSDVGLNVELEWVEAAVKNRLQVKPFEEGRRAQIFVDQHDNTSGDPVFTLPSRYGSEGAQSKVADPELDQLLKEAAGATGEARVDAWKAAAAKIEEILPDTMLFHMVGYAAIGDGIEYTPTMFTNSSVQLADISLK
ncbi:ABC transporter substrate-binding protein [Halovulum marinum]|uniref:ABC transporter substrate-binding protein n=1 Tax=Halovulum marinum TaxID=2662447 RepID=UPI002D77D622|nr:ABC transporter substrate-binding protein [Halovulum marinum]